MQFDDRVGLEAGTLVDMASCIADDARSPDQVVGVAVDMAVDPEVRFTSLDPVPGPSAGPMAGSRGDPVAPGS
ncbi:MULTISPECIES: hypothetical protein [unclassified Methylobacterium]|uniref:hypothetical protein n=1 Tax=unclassified Methylobacterium TaxID=2615210 RepID=UPI0005BD060D|nr:MULTISPECIES: hypothetical protein [unclassified Methylobacterium]